jgi:AraC-like DNA-binding protein
MKLMRTREGVAFQSEFVALPRHAVRQNAEFGMAVLLKALRELAGRNIHPSRVAFAHARNSNLPEFDRYFGCDVEFARAAMEGTSSDLFEFSNDVLAIPLITADVKLVRALAPFVEMAERERKTPAGSLCAAVENEVEKLLPHGKANAKAVAKALALSVRTLSRRLAEEGTTYAEVVDRLRRSLALQYLKEPGITLSEIAWLLGYQGSTSFNHAFKRWTGYSPTETRNRKALPAPG